MIYPNSWVHLRGSVIQANGMLTFEDDLRSGGLLYFTTSIHTELADSMVTLAETIGIGFGAEILKIKTDFFFFRFFFQNFSSISAYYGNISF